MHDKDKKNFIGEQVDKCYIGYNLNCAKTMLKILGDFYDIKIEKQVYDSATGLNGAGRYGAQCGLVEGCLMFIGIIGEKHNFKKEEILTICRDFARDFQKKFGSVLCSNLRPKIVTSNSIHLCENLTKDAVLFVMDFLKSRI